MEEEAVMRQPFFSVPIATYNRSADLEFALKRLLAQTFIDFEIIVSDDNSPDDTEKVVKKLNDKRIKYYKNRKNLGAVNNIRKVLTYPIGKYIFLHGDDDYLLYDTVLEDAYRMIRKHDYGLLRYNYLYQSFDRKTVFDFYRNKFTGSDLKMKPGQNPLSVLEYIEKIDLYFITGIVFKNPIPEKTTILDSELMPWFPVCYKNIVAQGGYYDSSYKVIASWSRQARHPVYYVEKGKLPFENYYEAIKKVSGESYYRKVLDRQLAISVNFLAIIKFNSDNQNLIKYAKRILELQPAYKGSLKFWCSFIASFLAPKFILSFVRMLYIRRSAAVGKITNYDEIIQQVRKVRGMKEEKL
jgi:glycosyltransferase involved in cell wall biosynthesis